LRRETSHGGWATFHGGWAEPAGSPLPSATDARAEAAAAAGVAAKGEEGAGGEGGEGAAVRSSEAAESDASSAAAAAAACSGAAKTTHGATHGPLPGKRLPRLPLPPPPPVPAPFDGGDAGGLANTKRGAVEAPPADDGNAPGKAPGEAAGDAKDPLNEPGEGDVGDAALRALLPAPEPIHSVRKQELKVATSASKSGPAARPVSAAVLRKRARQSQFQTRSRKNAQTNLPLFSGFFWYG
jgi:hypothetical protein